MGVKAIRGAPVVNLADAPEVVGENDGFNEYRLVSVFNAPDRRPFLSLVWFDAYRQELLTDDYFDRPW